MSILITIFDAMLTTITVLMALYAVGNVLLPLFNLRMDIRIKFYKAKKAL